MTGGADNDVFVFNTAPNASTNRDVLVDFNHFLDTIQLDNAVFTKVGANGELKASAFFVARPPTMPTTASSTTRRPAR